MSYTNQPSDTVAHAAPSSGQCQIPRKRFAMKNFWINTENPFVTWSSDLTAIGTRPELIHDVVRSVLVSGAKHRIFDVVEAPAIHYRRDRDGALGDVLRRMLKQDKILDLFRFTGSAMMPGPPTSSTAETTLCHYDRANNLVEAVVTDLGALLASLEPVPDSIPNGMMKHYPAIRITGERYVDVRENTPVDRSSHPLPIEFRLCIHSDIWFPWIYGGAHLACDQRRMFDNRELANCHTPRFNAFLGEVAAAVRQAGGTFQVRPDESGKRAIHQVDDQSVQLDWMPPDGCIMPPEMLAIEWDSLI